MAAASRRFPWLELLERRDAPSATRAAIVDPSEAHPIATIEWRGENVRAYADQWVVGFDGDVPPTDPSFLVRPIGSGRALVDVPAGTSPTQAQSLLAGFSSVEPNFVVSLTSIPNDPNFGNLYGLHNTGQTIDGQAGIADADIDAPEAWDVTRGSSSVVIAVMDTGIDFGHPDLAPNVFVNPGEIAGNGIDDDGNGRIDDVSGWDFVNNDNLPQDDNLHGTHVSGVIAAASDNGIGVSGVAPQVKILPLKIFNSSGGGSLASILAAYDYVQTLHDLGIRVVAINNSFGFDVFVANFNNEITQSQSRNILVVASAGNVSRNNDSAPFYPSSFTQSNVIAVAASDNRDQKDPGSHWGLTSVDIAAPGVDIESTLLGGGYTSISGTSMSTAMVSGAAALLWSLAPDATYTQIRDAIFAGGDPIADYATGGSHPISTGKRLNLVGAIDQLEAAITPPTPTVTSLSPFIGPTTGGNTVVIVGTGFTFVESVKFGAANAQSFTVNSSSQITAVAPSGTVDVDVTVTNSTGTSATAGTSDDYIYLPAIASVEVNGGDIVARDVFGNPPALAGQNSIVAQILVTFTKPVTLDPGAFAITSLASSVTTNSVLPSTANVAVTATEVPSSGTPSTGYSQYVLTFNAGPGVNTFANDTPPHLGNAFTALASGVYRLDMTGSLVHGAAGDTAADDSETFWCLYGAVPDDGIRVTGAVGGGDDTLRVDGLALSEMYATFGSSADAAMPPYDVAYDSDLDGDVDGVDLSQLYLNFGTIWYF